jgi:cytochrome c-type biogenesis protein CcmH/NrfG
VQDKPEDGRNYHYLGNEYRSAGLFNEARASYAEALRLGNFKLGLFHSAYYLAICCLLQEDWVAAAKAGLEAVRIDPRYAEGHCFMGDVYSCTGNALYAKVWYRNALQCMAPPPDALLPIQYWAYSDHPRKRLRQIGDSLD